MERLKICRNNIDFCPSGKIDLPFHKGDAGYDLYAAGHPRIVGDVFQGNLFKSISYIEYETNLSVEPNKDDYEDYTFYSLLFPRSSISKYNLSLCNSVGVIDSGYNDSIKIRFNYLPQPENYSILDSKHMLLGIDSSKIYQKGDKIGQLVWVGHFHPHVEFSVNLPPSDRGLGGFGSTGI